jgi:ABC-type branched-subunit amino acid transport system substrate-binding protein
MFRARRASQVATVWCVFAAFAMTVPACSLLLDADANQCNTTADCMARFPHQHGCGGLVCGPDHICAENAMFCCETNADCIDAFNGRPYICRQADRRCLPLTSIDCPRVLTDPDGHELRDDSTVLLGATCGLTGPDASVGVNACNGIEMAVREIRAQGGLPALTAGGRKRPLAVVVCDDTRDPAHGSSVNALKHLTADVHVPIVLGTSSSDLDLTAIADFAVQTGTLFIGHSARSFKIDSAGVGGEERLYYRTSASDLQHIPTLVRAIPDYFEPTLRRAGGPLQGGQPLKVMVLLRRDDTNMTAADLIFATIRINGTLPSTTNDDNVRFFAYGANAEAGSDGIEAAGVVQVVTAYKPHVLVLQGSDEVYTSLIPRIEQAWTETAYRPQMLIGGGNGQTPLLLSAIAKNDDLRRRTFGFSTGPLAQENPNYARFLRSYPQAFPDAGTGSPATILAAQGYDAAWTAFYAIAVDGSRAVSELLPGPGRAKVDVGPDGIVVGLGALRTGMDLAGASGPLDFDLATGTAEQDVDMWYCTADEAGVATGFTSSGYHYSAAEKRIVGTPTAH